MSISHAYDEFSTLSIQEIFESLSRSFTALFKRAKNNTLTHLEKELYEQFAAVERQCMQKNIGAI